MKKLISTIVSILLVATLFYGCGADSIPLLYDNQIKEDGSYDESLFYRNDLELLGADPQVLYIDDPESDQYGQFFMYDTAPGAQTYIAYRSTDLQNWENYSAKVGFPAFYPVEDAFHFTDLYAPEVIQDKEDGKYYLFYGARDYAIADNMIVIGVAIADTPYGPFVPYHKAGENKATPLFEHAAMKQTILDAGDKWGPTEATDEFACYDASPYVAPDGQRYLYFMRDRQGAEQNMYIWGVKMKSWTEPDLTTLERLTRPGYLTVNDMSDANKADYEIGNEVNEGPFMWHSKQADGSYRYYLTFSIFGASDKTYSVAQAVGTSPLGPFTKLRREDGGLLTGTEDATWDHYSGPGHHSFVRIGEELAIVYHGHLDRVNGGNSFRGIAADRVYLTKNAKGEEVLYANAPTWAIHPKFDQVSEFVDIAGEAKVSAKNGQNVEALTDRLLSLYSYIDYVKEFTTNKTTTITLNFDDYREITALMVYNSKSFEKSFLNIQRVEFDFKDAEKDFEGTAYIDNLEFDWERYRNENGVMMRPGGSAIAVFQPMKVNSIKITVELPKQRPEGFEIYDTATGLVTQQTEIGISEIVVLGK